MSRLKRAREVATAPFVWFNDNVISPIVSFVSTQFNKLKGFVVGVFTRSTPATSVDSQSPAAPLVAVATQPRFAGLRNLIPSFSNPFAGFGARMSSFFKTPEVKAAEPQQPVVTSLISSTTEQDEAQLVQSGTEAANAEGLAAEEAARLEQERLAAEEAARLEQERLAAEEAARLAQLTTAAVVDTKAKAANDGKRPGVVARLDSARRGYGLTGDRVWNNLPSFRSRKSNKPTVDAAATQQADVVVAEQKRSSNSPRNSNA